MADDLEYREIVIFETIVDVGFGQDGKEPDQGTPDKKNADGISDRNRAGMGVDQQDGGAERITYDLDGQGMPAMRRRGASTPPAAARRRARPRRPVSPWILKQ